MSIRNLDALLRPRSVALIGASDRPGSVGLKVAQNLAAGGFKGPIFLVNPKHREIAGLSCYPNLAALPAVPDLAVIATPPATVPGIVAELAQLGCRAVVGITAGLDAVQKQAMLDASKAKLVRIQGPNSVGLMLPSLGLNASFSHRAALKGDLAFLSQSGALVTSVVDWAASHNIGFSQVVSLGDMADVDFGDLIDYLAGDTQSRAILLYVEALTEAPKFLSAARRAARSKPVIVIKSGRHASGAKAAASHTGRLAGSDAAYEAAFRRAGLLRVLALEELFEAAEMLARAPRVSGERLMILTNGGGAGVLAADHLADEKGRLADLGEETRSALDKILPPNWSRGNPVDVIGDVSPEKYAASLEFLLKDKDCDAVLAIDCPTALASSTEIAEKVVETYKRSRSAKVLVTNWLGADVAEDARRIFAENRIPTFETPGAAVRGFMQVVRYSRAQEELMRTPPMMAEPTCDAARVEQIIGEAMPAGRMVLSEVEAKEVLKAYGINVVPTLPVSDPAAASKAAEGLLKDYTSVVLKILSDDISHKSDVGGVHLDLATARAVEDAANAMLERVRERQPDARIKGFTVSPMVVRPEAQELIVGVSVDATFGPLIMFGSGGTAVEVMRDTSLALPPLDYRLARDLIGRTRVSRLLAGYRHAKPADMDAITRTLMLVSSLVCRHPEIRELDINPLLADASGAIVLDARVVVADETTQPRVPMVVKPYPVQWERAETLPSGANVVIRPVRPEDELLYGEFLKHVTPEDLRLRLFAPQRELSHAFLARLTQIDYAREIAFVMLDPATGHLLGVSRFIADPDYETAEYAVIVRSDLKGKGFGWRLMQMLIEYARATGIAEIYGSVLAENTNMLSMCRHLGFKVTTEPDDLSVRHVSLKIAEVRNEASGH